MKNKTIGFIKLHRKLLDSEVSYYGLKHLGFLNVILLNCNWEEKIWEKENEIIKKGEFVTSLNKLALACDESIKSVRKLLKDFQKMGIIKTTVRAKKFTKISVCNWDSYQYTEEEEGIQKDKEEGIQKDKEEGIQKDKEVAPKKDKKRATTKEGKNTRNTSESSKKVVIGNYRELCEWYYKELLRVEPTKKIMINRTYDIEAWNKTIDNIIRIKGYDYKTVTTVLNFALTDDFWRTQVISLNGLTKKSDNGLIKFENILNKAIVNKTSDNNFQSQHEQSKTFKQKQKEINNQLPKEEGLMLEDLFDNTNVTKNLKGVSNG